jgi:signal transduction histidine kinase
MLSSLRARLIVAYTGLILLGFGGLLLLAGGQISMLARSDYEQRLVTETSLAARGIGDYLANQAGSRIKQADIDAAIEAYQNQTSGTLSFTVETRPNGRGPGDGSPMRPNPAPEIETSDGYLVASSPVFIGRTLIGRAEIRVPLNELDNAVIRRWLELGAGFFALTLVAVGASIWLSNTLIHPLQVLRETALRLSKGDFSQRVQYSGVDEISAVVGAFNEMAFQVESMLEEQRAFASNTSHELRTPLTTIRLRTEALLDDTGLDEALQRQYITEIDGEVKRLSDLVTDLTLLSRLDAGRADLGSEEIDFSRFAQQLQMQTAGHARQSGVRVELQLPPAPIVLRGSVNHLTVLFRNLLDNAIKYSHPGGSIFWQVETDGAYVRSQIIDNGRGIPAEHIPHVFDRFYRADKARSRDVPGTGLGLALVKSIVEAYQGNIRIESAGTDRGTTVYVALPRAPLTGQPNS